MAIKPAWWDGPWRWRRQSLAESSPRCILNPASYYLRFACFRCFTLRDGRSSAVSARTAREGQLPQRYSQQARSNAGRADGSWRQEGIGFHSTLRRHSAAGGTVAVTYGPRSKRIRLLVIEDHRILRDAIATMLRAEPDLQVSAGAGGAAVLQQALDVKLDVILLNAGRGDHDSARLVASVKRASPEAKVIVTDLVPERADICELVRAGASGFLLRDATLEEFVTTIRTVARGERVLPAPLTAKLFAHIAEPGVGRSEPAMAKPPKVTKREREMLDLIADGLSNKAIAQRLSIATNTVKGHVHHLLGKLALRTRLEAAAYARNGDGGA